MKKFILKSAWFIFPIFAISFFTFKFNSRKGTPDLLRLGSIINLYPDYLNIFAEDFKNKLNFTKYSDLSTKRDFKFLTIGDSFSEQAEEGYKNYLSNKKENSLLHLDKFLVKNQIEVLYNLINGDFFNKYHFEYVILQNVERHIIENSKNINKKTVISVESLNTLVMARNEKNKESYGLNFFSDFKFPSKNIFIFPYNIYQYFNQNTFLFEDNVYKTKMTEDFFYVGNKNLLFYQYDVFAMEKNNDEENVLQLNKIFNDLNDLLKKRGIKLIVLPCPDKYSIYHKYIENRKGFDKPLFFEHFQKMPKDYIYINSKTLLDSAVKTTKDIYYYDDTHWSPRASKIIANEIDIKINSDKGK